MKGAFFTGLLFLPLLLYGQSRPAFPSLEASPRAREYARRIVPAPAASRSGNYWKDLAEAALWASSLNAGPGAEEKAASYADRIAAAVSELAAMEDLPRDPKERGEYVLTFLHRRFLKSYSEYQTRVDEIFVSGRYNCVSSAVLYMVLGFSVGLDIEGVVTKDHAFVTVGAGAERIDVETTNSYGFDPGNRKEFHDGFGQVTGFAYVPAKNYRDRAALNEAELISLILSNRIAVLEKANRYAEAVPLAVNRAVLLGVNGNAPAQTGGTAAGSAAQAGGAVQAGGTNQSKSEFFEDPRRDVMNRIFNLGSHLLRTGKEDEALAWVEYASPAFPDPPRWREFVYAAVNNKLVKLIRGKKTADARSALASLGRAGEHLTAEQRRSLEALVIEAEAADLVNGVKNPGDAEAALAFLSQVWDRLPAERREEMRIAAVLKEAERIGRTRDWIRGMIWLKAAMESYGEAARFRSAYNTFRQNRIGELHNEFANLYNKKDYTGAKASVQRALAEFPEERQFIQDLNLAEKALQQ
jgi:tetratricopeptide (TPR) repeat protein